MNIRHDRIIHLENIWSYPGSEFLDQLVFIPSSDNVKRRVFLQIESGMPDLSFDEITISPESADKGVLRWLDYGLVELPFLRRQNWSGGYFAQLKIFNISASVAKNASLLITKDLTFSPSGRNLDEVKEALWGLSSEKAGSISVTPSSACAGDPVTFDIRYTVGADGLPVGSLLRFTLPSVFPPPQSQFPDHNGYLQIMNGKDNLEMVSVNGSNESHEMTDIIFRLNDGGDPGEVFLLSYFCESLPIFINAYKQADRINWWQRMPPFAAAVAINPEHPFVSLLQHNSHIFEVLPGEVSRLHLFLPGRVFSGDGVILKGLFTDKYRNVPPSGQPDFQFDLWLACNGKRSKIFEAIRSSAKHRFSVDFGKLEPGIYRVYALDKQSGEEIARSNPLQVLEEDDSKEKIYWGEIHAHSEMSDGVGLYAQIYSHAYLEGCLDFAAGCDHAAYFTDNQWEWMQDITNHWNKSGEFVTLVGYEWGGKQMHRNIYTAEDNLEFVRGRMMPDKEVDELWQKYKDPSNIVGGPHGSIGHGLIWEKHNPEIERFIEIYSMWGASDFLHSPLSLLESPASEGWNNPNALSVNEVLLTGAKLGFTGGGDCHEANAGFSCEDPAGQGIVPHTFSKRLPFRCGLTAALMPELTRKNLIQSLRQRKTYATTGARILLNFEVSGIGMGGIGASEKIVCQYEVHAVSEIEKIEIIRSGEVVYEKNGVGLDLDLSWEDPAPLEGEQYYYLHIIQKDGQEAWSSPVWVSRKE